MDHTKYTLQLPLGIVSTVDVGRLLREVDALEIFMKSAEVRQPGTSVQLPKTSKLLDEFLEINKKSALKSEDRQEVSMFLRDLRAHAPSIHMSFSADPSPLFTQRLVQWLRQNIHASILLQIGLQPTIGAGVIVRTTNKYFDFSLRDFFDSKKPILLAKLRSTEAASNEPTTDNLTEAAQQPQAHAEQTQAQVQAGSPPVQPATLPDQQSAQPQPAATSLPTPIAIEEDVS